MVLPNVPCPHWKGHYLLGFRVFIAHFYLYSSKKGTFAIHWHATKLSPKYLGLYTCATLSLQHRCFCLQWTAFNAETQGCPRWWEQMTFVCSALNWTPMISSKAQLTLWKKGEKNAWVSQWRRGLWETILQACNDCGIHELTTGRVACLRPAQNQHPKQSVINGGGVHGSD